MMVCVRVRSMVEPNPNDGVRSLLAQLRLQSFYERNQNASLNLCLFDHRNAHTSPLCSIASTGN
jgi:hypothetical protein